MGKFKKKTGKTRVGSALSKIGSGIKSAASKVASFGAKGGLAGMGAKAVGQQIKKGAQQGKFGALGNALTKPKSKSYGVQYGPVKPGFEGPKRPGGGTKISGKYSGGASLTGETVPGEEFAMEEEIPQETELTGIPEAPGPISETPETEVAAVPKEDAVAPEAGGVPGSSIAQAEGGVGSALPPATQTLRDRYIQAAGAANAGGMAAPLDSASGMAGISEYLPPVPQASPVDSIFSEDPFFGNLMQTFTDYMSPENQRASLTKTYQKLTKQSGIDELDTELMNMKNVIDGTEDDIRNEITKAGGFATESQVAALTNSRNKQLIQNYNNLLETRNQKQDYIDKMIGLEAQDRQAADQRFDRMFNIGMQIMNYKDKMKQNAVDGYNKIVENVGYNGLLKMTNNDPYYVSLIEKSMGLGSGGLSRLATMQTLAQQREARIALGEGSKASVSSLKSLPEFRNVDEADVPLSDLMAKYKKFLSKHTFIDTVRNPSLVAERDNLIAQITAEYKQAKKLGTLDAGVEKVIKGILGRKGIAKYSHAAQQKAIGNQLLQMGYIEPITAPDGTEVIITE